MRLLLIAVLALSACDMSEGQRREQTVVDLKPVFKDLSGRCWVLKNSGGKYEASLLMLIVCPQVAE